jgi:hypothetical protein
MAGFAPPCDDGLANRCLSVVQLKLTPSTSKCQALPLNGSFIQQKNPKARLNKLLIVENCQVSLIKSASKQRETSGGRSSFVKQKVPTGTELNS